MQAETDKEKKTRQAFETIAIALLLLTFALAMGAKDECISWWWVPVPLVVALGWPWVYYGTLALWRWLREEQEPIPAQLARHVRAQADANAQTAATLDRLNRALQERAEAFSVVADLAPPAPRHVMNPKPRTFPLDPSECGDHEGKQCVVTMEHDASGQLELGLKCEGCGAWRVRHCNRCGGPTPEVSARGRCGICEGLT